MLQALSDALWKDISGKAPSPTAFYAPQDQPFSKRNPASEEDEYGYGPIESWLDFQQEILKFSRNRNYIVVTDIANYYDCILHRFLRSILGEYGLEKEHALDLLLFILDAMLWRPDYMPNFGIGLPQMDLDAPRLLAHTHLFEIDRIFELDPSVDFARYMDDMDFGVDTVAEAKRVLRDLDLALHTRNIRLNSGKTKILTAAKAELHFRVRDNDRVSKLSDRIKKWSFLTKRDIIFARMLSRLISSGLQNSYFDEGNGIKILKRLITICGRLAYGVGDKEFRVILYDFPALRQNLLNTWIRSPNWQAQISIAFGFLGSGQAVDDFAAIAIADAILSGPHGKKLGPKQLYETLYHLKGNDHFRTFSRIWLLTRFGARSSLMEEIRSTREIWGRHPFVARLVAGCSGLLYKTNYYSEFQRLVRNFGGAEAKSVLEFHEALIEESWAYNAVKIFIEAGAPSSPLGISHAKSLMLASALWNRGIPKAARATLLGNHGQMMRDIYYRKRFSSIITRAQ